MKKIIKNTVVVIASFFVFYCAYAAYDGHARGKILNDMCSSFDVGMTETAFEEQVKIHKGRIRYRFDEGVIVYAPVAGVCKCRVFIQQGVITGKGEAWCQH